MWAIWKVPVPIDLSKSSYVVKNYVVTKDA